MTTPRKPSVPITHAIDAFCAQFDDLFTRRAARQAFRHDLIGLLLPREHNKTMTVVADCSHGEHPTFTANLFCADIPYVVAIHSNHGKAGPPIEAALAGVARRAGASS